MKDRKRFSFLGIPRQRRFVFSDTLALVQHSLAPLTGTARLHAELMHKQKEGSYELPTTNRICLPIISLILSNTINILFFTISIMHIVWKPVLYHLGIFFS